MESQPVRILLVDDSEGDYDLTRVLLSEIETNRFDLDWISDYGSALEAIQRREHDVYLLDHELGSHTGVELLREALERGVDAPMIMLTGRSDRLVDMEAMEAGAADFLVKGDLRADQLERSIRYATERHRLLAELARLAKTDPLTGLANRTLFREFLEGAMARADRSAKRIGLLLLDLDHFKEINDSLGHDAGDLVLKGIAERLKACVRVGDLVARLGGDEFAVVLDDIDNEKNAGRVAEKIIDVLAQPHAFEGRKLRVGASIGIATYSNGSKDLEVLIKGADMAMYDAKALGRNNYRLFSTEIQARSAPSDQ